MMGGLKIFIMWLLAGVSASDPEVYEIVDESPPSRVSRQPNDHKVAVYYSPPMFHYSGASQQDLRRSRYAKQQEIDVKNYLKRRLKRKDFTPVEATYWKVADPNLVKNQRVSPSTENTDLMVDSIWKQLTQISNARKARQIRTAPNVYSDDRQESTEEDSEENEEQKEEQNLGALNALLGQHPRTQLEGLKKLLEAPGYVLIPPLNNRFQTRDHIPIKEQIMDIPNKLEKKLIKFDDKDAVLQSLQAHLDAAAQAQAERVLADAQQQAFAHVKAQEEAIEKAKLEAEKQALAQIRAQNAHLTQAQSLENSKLEAESQHSQPEQQFFHPLVAPLRSEVVPSGPEHEVLPQAEALIYTQSNSPKTEIIYENYVPHYQEPEVKEENTILPQSEELLKKPDLEKISITKTHSYTKGRHSPPGVYQQKVVLETEREKVIPLKAKKEAVDDDEEVYASRYAFGYRIKDFKMGNDFGHEEKREGKSARGHYHVLLPDGRLQKVEYYADPTGYHAKVTYENVAHH